MRQERPPLTGIRIEPALVEDDVISIGVGLGTGVLRRLCRIASGMNAHIAEVVAHPLTIERLILFRHRLATAPDVPDVFDSPGARSTGVAFLLDLFLFFLLFRSVGSALHFIFFLLFLLLFRGMLHFLLFFLLIDGAL